MRPGQLPSPQSPSEPLVAVEAVAAHLGVRRSWVYAATAAGLLPHFRAGRYLRYRLSEVEDALVEIGARSQHRG